MTATLSQSDLLNTLRQVIDPELGCNIVDLGLIYSVELTGRKVEVRMTLTTSGCPMHENIRWGIESALLQWPWIDDVEVEIVWDPPWQPEMMTAVGRQITGYR